MSSGKGEDGYILIFLLFMILTLPLTVVYLANVTTQVKRVSAGMQGDLTRMRMGILKTSIIRESKDVDRDSYLESPADDGLERPPLNVMLVKKDALGNELKYCHWDLGSENTINPAYSQNSADPPVPGIIAALISSGEDGMFQISCGDFTTPGDDIVEYVFNSDARAYSK